MNGVTPPPPTTEPPAGQRVLAVFDLDKTILDTSASLAYRRPMAQRGLISTGEVVRMMALLGNYMLTTHSEAAMDATKNALLNIIRGQSTSALRSVAQDALQEVIIPFVYAEARELLARHREQGHKIAIITASASVLVEPIAAELKVDHLIATELEEVDGVFTGEVLHFNRGSAKVERLAELALTHGYALEDSHAYTDSATDLPLLEAVGHPHAVNPDRPLRKIAVERGWPIEQFRRPEPLFEQTKVLAGAGATLALLGAVAAGLTVWFRGREEEG
ncbi:HAD-IB family hydrolase [Corynebacterium heidelbergense]|uniref:HAD-IB family hydrolase n=1 Tax=Corynebacterium heidelbergense TaxID=2055947 RepID=A0A364V4I2_9CORY|nr:HAD-IB family hydrolase [Corynebacterium heidelbergense]